MRLFFVVGTVLAFFLVVAFGREYLGNLQIDQEIQTLEEEYAALQQEQLETLSLIEELSSEYYLEQEARTKQGLGKEGETLVVIKTTEEGVEVAGGAGGDSNEGEIQDVPNPIRWYYYFFSQDALPGLEDEV